jgi:hypothetical protein
MLYFLVDKYKDCINKMDETYDTVGCNYKENPYHHYSGNFWWANSNYIKTLNYLNEEIPDSHAPEFWVLQNSPNKYICHSSNINHYLNTYPEHLYKDKK